MLVSLRNSFFRQYTNVEKNILYHMFRKLPVNKNWDRRRFLEPTGLLSEFQGTNFNV